MDGACLDQDRRADRGGVAGRPRAAFLSLAVRILGPLGSQSFFDAAVIVRSMVIADKDLMIRVQTNGPENWESRQCDLRHRQETEGRLSSGAFARRVNAGSGAGR